jgi:hypothetical protein
LRFIHAAFGVRGAAENAPNPAAGSLRQRAKVGLLRAGGWLVAGEPLITIALGIVLDVAAGSLTPSPLDLELTFDPFPAREAAKPMTNTESAILWSD